MVNISTNTDSENLKQPAEAEPTMDSVDFGETMDDYEKSFGVLHQCGHSFHVMACAGGGLRGRNSLGRHLSGSLRRG